MEEIAAIVRGVRRRAALLAAFEGLAVGLSLAALAAAALVFVERLAAMFPPAPAAGALLALSVLAAVVVRVRRGRLTPVQAALAVDARYDLKERVTSAWLLRDDPSEFARAVARDARERLAGARSSQVVPWRLRRPWRLLPPFVLLAAVWLLPRLDVLGLQEGRLRAETERRAVVAEAHRLHREAEKLAVQIERPGESELAALVKEMSRLEKDFLEGRRAARDASMDLAELGEKFQQAGERLRRESPMPRLERPRPRDARFTGALEQALKAGDLAEAAREMDRLAERMGSGSLTDEQVRAAGRELESLAGALEGGGPMAENLAEAAEAAGKGDAPQAAEKAKAAAGEARSLLDAVNRLGMIETTVAAMKSAQKDLANSGST
jgi:hypothetical protein